VQIIVISDGAGRARSVTLSPKLLVLAMVVTASVFSAAAAGLYFATLNYATGTEFRMPGPFTLASQRAEAERAREFVQQNLNAMAVKIGEMQAQLTRLDALGERLSSLAGIRPQEFRFGRLPGLGGAAATLLPPQNLTLLEFNQRLQGLSRDVEGRADMLGVLEAKLFEEAVRKKLLPTMMPVEAPYNASGFGIRLDPFTGQRAMHEGIDFIADTGTAVVAAASGVVIFAGLHPQYGNVVDIDHGNDLTTRYAHAKKLFVKVGEFVQRGRRIGLVGSTGRSTGPHLHFEVRYKGAAQNPMRFLAKREGAAQKLAGARRTGTR